MKPRRSSIRRLLAGLTIALGMLAAPGAEAQQGSGRTGPAPTAAERAERRLTSLTAPLQLTAQQVEQLRPILTKQFMEQMAIAQRAQAGGDRSATRRETQALRRKTDDQIEALLTETQKPLYKALIEKERARRGGTGGNRR